MTITSGVDFLIVTTLREETTAVSELLEEKQGLASGIVGRILREGSAAKYEVALTEIGGMGTNEAQAATTRALSRWNPRYVILSGIAAGFPEAGVELGDIMVPRAIAPYELAKITERSFSQCLLHFFLCLRWEKIKYDHRSFPMRVSHTLWYAANILSMDRTCDWAQAIKEKRPDGFKKDPAVHCRSRSVLGCGDKVIAAKSADPRKWLINESSNHALGLEMESFGVLTACDVTDTPFLVVKASQDPATGEKDAPGKKDEWRLYAAQASAAFSIALIRRLELQYDALVVEHMKEVKQMVQNFRRDAPDPPFSYKVSRAASYANLKEGIYDSISQDPSVLIPYVAAPTLALHGGGGTGKSTILRSLFEKFVESELYPIFIDLKRYSIGQKKPRGSNDPEILLQDVLQDGGAPRRTPREIELLAKECRVIAVLDGLNEVSRELRMILLDYFQSLNKKGVCYIFVTDRFGAPEVMLEPFSHAAVDRLDKATVQRLFDSRFGAGEFERLDQNEQELFRRPFFLSLALRTKYRFTGAGSGSKIFQEFFVTQLRITEEQLDQIARSTAGAFSEDGSLNSSNFRQLIGNEEAYQTLIAAEVLNREGLGFEHHLWRDYFVSRHLTRKEGDWIDKVFDVVTTFSSSLECLTFTVEQLSDRTRKDLFLKKVFDWNYVAAADCIAEFREGDPELSQGIRTAILAAIAEKRFDSVKRTRERANDILSSHKYPFADGFREAISLETLVGHVETIVGGEGWFKEWKNLFRKGRETKLSIEETNLIASDDSLIGWTVANIARRAILDEAGQRRMREIYDDAVGAENRRSIRWRVVHALGAYPTDYNVKFLEGALNRDIYHWVQYGAARSLIEIASHSPVGLRDSVISELKEFINQYNPNNVWVRHQLLREVIEAAFVFKPEPGWKEAITPLMTSVVNKEVDPFYKSILKGKFEAFNAYDGT